MGWKRAEAMEVDVWSDEKASEDLEMEFMYVRSSEVALFDNSSETIGGCQWGEVRSINQQSINEVLKRARISPSQSRLAPPRRSREAGKTFLAQRNNKMNGFVDLLCIIPVHLCPFEAHLIWLLVFSIFFE